MDFGLLITGVIVGFLVAFPVGPVAILCLQRTLFDGRLVGYSTGLGAAVADTVFGALAIFSVSAVQSFLLDHHLVIQFLGGFVLIGLGLRTLLLRNKRKANNAISTASVDHETLLHAFGSAFAVTIVNPITVLAFISLFAAIRVSDPGHGLFDEWTVIFGVFVGATGWWFLLTSVASVLRQKFTDNGMRWMNATSGIAIMGFGIFALLTLAWH